MLWLYDGLMEAASNRGWSEDWANITHPPITNTNSAAALTGLLERSEVDDWPNNLAMRAANDPLFAAMSVG
jgi:hypothetical protein